MHSPSRSINGCGCLWGAVRLEVPGGHRAQPGCDSSSRESHRDFNHVAKAGEGRCHIGIQLLCAGHPLSE